MSRYPEVKWVQREDKIFLTVLLADAKDPKVNLQQDGVFTFSATAGADNHSYELKLHLFDKINVEESKINVEPRSIFCVLEKVEIKWWNKLVTGEAKTPHYVKVDWDKWVDEDEDTGSNDLDMGGMDFSKFGDIGGMGGMPGIGGMPAMDDFPMGDDDNEDSDDEVQGAQGGKPEGKDTTEERAETEKNTSKANGEATSGA